MTYAAAFAITGVALFGCALAAGPWPAKIVLGSIAVTGGALAFVFATARAACLGKRPQGRFAPWAYPVFWPYLSINHLLLRSFRRLTSEPPCSEILPGLWMGCRPFSFERAAFTGLRARAVLDLTSEFSEAPFARNSAEYRCIPVLDTFAPSQDQLASATDWIAARLRDGPVYVHCAFGHGRSATVVAAYLLRSGHAATAEEAIGFVKSRRPWIVLHPRQQSAVSAYGRSLASPS